MLVRVAVSCLLLASAAFAEPKLDQIAPVDSAAKLVRAGVEAHAFSAASPGAVKREVEFLARTSSTDAAEALLAEVRHACTLARDLDLSQERLHRQQERLAKQASKVRRTRRKASAEALESKQRQLELTATKFTIQAEQRERLAALRDALLEALEGKTDAAAVQVFSQALRRERDPVLGSALARALGQAKSPAAVPALLKALARRPLRPAARAALVKITGHDLGDDPKAWATPKESE